MATVKGIIEDFLYTHIDYYSERVFREGEDCVIDGIPVLKEDSAFTHGALINATAILYLHYRRLSNEEKTAQALERLNLFIDITAKRESVATWGKLGILRALYKLKKQGCLSVISDERLDRMNALTDYSDFLDKETLSLKSKPTNYYQVALAAAAYREKLGFEDCGYADRIEEKFISTHFPDDDSFMDDEAGRGRYDRYSLILSSEISDLYLDLGRDMPERILKNLKKCAKYALFMSNSAGDGINYGRSLSVHGDLAPAEILASALSRNLIEDGDKNHALAYIYRILEKTLYFWYDSGMRSFNLWLKGRTTNDYRQIHRLLEVNMDMVAHLCALLESIKAASLEDEKINPRLPEPEKWEHLRIDFDTERCAYVLRYRDYLAFLPFIGTAAWGLHSAYNPFPSINGIAEASPESILPFLIPEYTNSKGEKFRPAHFVKKTEEKAREDGLLISAYGRLMDCSSLSETEIEYRQDFLFGKDSIISEIEVFGEFTQAEMMSATQDAGATILVGGFGESTPLKIEDTNDFKTPHGSYKTAYMHRSSTPSRLGYKVDFN